MILRLCQKWSVNRCVKSSNNIENSLEKMFFCTFRKLDFGAVLGVGSAAKVVSKRSWGTSHEKKFMLILLDNSIGADLQKWREALCRWNFSSELRWTLLSLSLERTKLPRGRCRRERVKSLSLDGASGRMTGSALARYELRGTFRASAGRAKAS